GRGHLESGDGGPPADAAAWGWHSNGDWRPQGKRVGWVEGENLYLNPEIAYAEAQTLGEAQGERLPLSQAQLYRKLKEQGLLASYEPDKTTNRRRLQGIKCSVLHLHASALYPSREQGTQGTQGTGCEKPGDFGPCSVPCSAPLSPEQGTEQG